MGTISGVDVGLITKIGGISTSNIRYIGGVDTREIPGWPSGPPSCNDVSFSFGPAPGIACSAGASFYSFDSTNNLLYNFGSCGGDFAIEGFYSDGMTVYWWHTVGRILVWELIGPCG